MGTFFALLALCEGNPPVNCGFPLQRSVTRSFDFFFDVHLNKRISKQSRRRWSETPSRSLWRHSNANHYMAVIEHHLDVIMTQYSAYDYINTLTYSICYKTGVLLYLFLHYWYWWFIICLLQTKTSRVIFLFPQSKESAVLSLHLFAQWKLHINDLSHWTWSIFNP